MEREYAYTLYVSLDQNDFILLGWFIYATSRPFDYRYTLRIEYAGDEARRFIESARETESTVYLRVVSERLVHGAFYIKAFVLERRA